MYYTCNWVMAMQPVLIVMGSVRPGRICPTLAQWVQRIGTESTALSFEIVDLADWELSFDGEPGLPQRGHYQNPVTKAWSAKVAGASAIVVVTPQYNWGYPAVLKNALDHLYNEWRDKPGMIVSYGGHGGGKCAEQLRQVMTAMKMRVAETAPGIHLTDAIIRDNASFEPEVDFAKDRGSIVEAFGQLLALCGEVKKDVAVNVAAP